MIVVSRRRNRGEILNQSNFACLHERPSFGLERNRIRGGASEKPALGERHHLGAADYDVIDDADIEEV